MKEEPPIDSNGGGTIRRNSVSTIQLAARAVSCLVLFLCNYIQNVHKVRSYFVENGIFFLIYTILLYRCMLFIAKLCIKILFNFWRIAYCRFSL